METFTKPGEVESLQDASRAGVKVEEGVWGSITGKCNASLHESSQQRWDPRRAESEELSHAETSV